MTSTNPKIPTDTGDVLVRARRVRERYDKISDVTLWRWIRDEVFPPPDRVINGQRFWFLSTLEEWEAERQREAS